MKSIFSWFKNSVKIKRWIFLILVGIGLVSYSLSKMLMLYILDVKEILIMIASLISGILVTIFAIVQIQKRTLEIFIEANGINHKNLKEKNIQVDSLIFDKNIYDNGPKVVVIGGGTGLDTVIAGLKKYTNNITAISLLSEEEGREMQDLMYKDIKDSISALARTEGIMEELLNWNYESEDLMGLNFGDLYIKAIEEMTGTVAGGLNRTKDILNMVGEVTPTSLDDTMVCVEFIDGTVVSGKERIPKESIKIEKEISRVYLSPSNIRTNPLALEKILDADLIVFAPGRLYTNVIPNLLVKEIATTIRQAKAPKVYIANIMTELEETRNYKLSDHIQAIFDHSGGKVFDFCICDTGEIIPEYVRLYHKKGAEVLYVDTDKLKELDIRIMKRDLSKVVGDKIRHDEDAIALALMEIIFSDLKYNEEHNDLKYAVLKEVLREQRKIQKRKDKNLKKWKKGKDPKRANMQNMRRKPGYRSTFNDKLKNNLEEQYNRFEENEAQNFSEESNFFKKYKDRIESVKNADKTQKDNLKKAKQEEKKKNKGE